MCKRFRWCQDNFPNSIVPNAILPNLPFYSMPILIYPIVKWPVGLETIAIERRIIERKDQRASGKLALGVVAGWVNWIVVNCHKIDIIARPIYACIQQLYQAIISGTMPIFEFSANIHPG